MVWFYFKDKKSLESVCTAFARLVDNVQNDGVITLFQNFIWKNYQSKLAMTPTSDALRDVLASVQFKIVKTSMEMCYFWIFTKSNTPPFVFFSRFFKLCKWTKSRKASQFNNSGSAFLELEALKRIRVQKNL